MLAAETKDMTKSRAEVAREITCKILRHKAIGVTEYPPWLKRL
jgi:hypothetical protein